MKPKPVMADYTLSYINHDGIREWMGVSRQRKAATLAFLRKAGIWKIDVCIGSGLEDGKKIPFTAELMARLNPTPEDLGLKRRAFTVHTN